jgi:superfamily II DNA or RNA helicase
MKTLYPVQTAHADKLEQSLRSNRAALDASETGCGKTVVAVDLARRLGLRTIVVCPKATIPAWTKELKEQGVRATVINYEKLRTGNTALGGFNKRQWVWKTPDTDMLIIWDEVQRCMSMKSQNSKMLAGSKKFHNLLLSATAAEDPTEMKALGYVLGLHGLSDFWTWLRKHGCKPNPWGALEFKGGEKELLKIHHNIFNVGKGSRLRVADMKAHFADTQIITEPVDFGDEGEIGKLYETMEEEILQLHSEMQDDSSNPAAQALVKQLRARQQVELLKIPYIVEAAQDAIREKRSVAIFVNFDATLEAICERLKTTCVIKGGQSIEQRKACMDEFQNGVSKTIVCNIAAGGTGVSLHDVTGNHPRTALISPSFNAKELLQVMGRVHRAGGKSPSQQRVLFAAGTIEEKIEASIRKKLKNLEIFNQGGLTDETEELKNHITQMQNTPNVEPDHQSRAHAKYSPSSLTYREICPGWQNDDDPNKDNSAAEEGTRCHEAMEKEDTKGLTEEQTLLVETCLGYINDLKTAKTRVFKEERLKILDQFGTADWILIDGYKAHLVDTKFGRRSVPDAEVNAQLQAYALGVWDRWEAVEELTVHILLPRRDEVSTHTYTRAKDYENIRLRIETIIARAKEALPEFFNPTPSGCQYCGRKGKCGALAGVALKKAKEASLDKDEVLDVTKPEQISEFLKMAPILEDWIKKVREEALRVHLYEGVDIPGFRCVDRSTPRTITSPMGAWSVLQDKMTMDDFMASVSRISITELEKNFAATAGKGQKGKSKQQLENLLRDAGVLKEESTIKYLKPIKD